MSGEDGDRTAQKISGSVALLVSAGLLLGHYVTGHAPSNVELYIGGGALVAGLWLIAPVGMGRLGKQIRKSWHEFRGHGEGA